MTTPATKEPDYAKLGQLVDRELSSWNARSQVQQVSKNIIRLMARQAQSKIAELTKRVAALAHACAKANDYCQQQGIGKWGESATAALIADHKRLADLQPVGLFVNPFGTPCNWEQVDDSCIGDPDVIPLYARADSPPHARAAAAYPPYDQCTALKHVPASYAANTADATQPDMVPMPRALLQGLVDVWNREGVTNQGAPDHGHNVPGVWDSDWADGRAGQPCEECALYDQARALLNGGAQ